MKFDVIIRIKNSERTIANVLNSLNGQSIKPTNYIFVDNSSTDDTLKIINDNLAGNKYIIVDYPKKCDFNYSKSLNLGITFLQSPFCLILSSHTQLDNPYALEYALNLFKIHVEKLVGICFAGEENTEQLMYEIIDKKNYDGFNGLWNTASLYRSIDLLSDNFNESIGSCEDQYWSMLRFREGKCIYHIRGCGRRNKSNHLLNFVKHFCDFNQISIYINPKLLSCRFISGILYRYINSLKRDDEYKTVNLAFLISAILTVITKKDLYFIKKLL